MPRAGSGERDLEDVELVAAGDTQQHVKTE